MAPKQPRLLRLTVSYEGTRYAGWQRQKNTRTVQGTLEEALGKILGEKVHVVGAGRTDSGVHAQAQVAHATIHSGMSVSNLQRALNAVLAKDILVRSIRCERPPFHARYSATKKLYRYTIVNGRLRPLFDRNLVLHVPAKLDLHKMRQAARLLEGRHNFRAFHSSGRPLTESVRTLHSLKVKDRKNRILIEAEANGFLYHMVRRMTGLLLEIGKGTLPPTITRDLLAGTSAVPAPTAPAQGLCLVKVSYPNGRRPS